MAIATTVDVLIMKNANGTFARLTAVMEDATVEKTAGAVVATVIAQVMRDATTLGTVTPIAEMENATVMRIVRVVMTVAAKKTKTAAQAHQKQVQEAAWTGVVTV